MANGLLRQTLDLPLGERAPTRWIGWCAAVLVGAAVLAAALAVAAAESARRGTLEPVPATVLLPTRAGVAPSDAEVARVAAALGAIPGVAYARPVTPSELGLEPPEAAVGAGAPPPLAHLIDLALNPGRPVDLKALSAQVAEVAPEARLGLGERQPVGAGAGVWRGLALAALAALGLAVAGLTRLSLALHRETIDLLRQLGADDGYVARQLGQHALTQALRGGLVGFLTGLPAALATMAMAGGGSLALDLAPFDCALLAAIPPAAAVLARSAAELAARHPRGG